MQGVHSLRIHGQVYFSIGPLRTAVAAQPVFAQTSGHVDHLDIPQRSLIDAFTPYSHERQPPSSGAPLPVCRAAFLPVSSRSPTTLLLLAVRDIRLPCLTPTLHSSVDRIVRSSRSAVLVVASVKSLGRRNRSVESIDLSN